MRVQEIVRDRGLDWPRVEAMTDDGLEALLHGRRRIPGKRRPLPDPSWIHSEMKRAGVILELLRLEYFERQPDGYRYTTFCDPCRRWLEGRGLSMRQIHRAGEKLFVDYSGKKPHIVDPKTSEVIAVEVFVAVLGASNYTYAEATLTQKWRCSAPPTTPTPKRHSRRRAGTGSRATSARSIISAASRS